MVSIFPASTYGSLYFRNLEAYKTVSLKKFVGNYDKHIILSRKCKEEILWWKENILTMSKAINIPPISHEISYDASLTGWGCMFRKQKAWGHWCKTSDDHINVLEMKAILLGLKSFKNHFFHSHIKIYSDNTTAITVINKMGTSHSNDCNEMAQKYGNSAKNIRYGLPVLISQEWRM